jgi:hypothetical protein
MHKLLNMFKAIPLSPPSKGENSSPDYSGGGIGGCFKRYY